MDTLSSVIQAVDTTKEALASYIKLFWWALTAVGGLLTVAFGIAFAQLKETRDNSNAITKDYTDKFDKLQMNNQGKFDAIMEVVIEVKENLARQGATLESNHNDIKEVKVRIEKVIDNMINKKDQKENV